MMTTLHPCADPRDHLPCGCGHAAHDHAGETCHGTAGTMIGQTAAESGMDPDMPCLCTAYGPAPMTLPTLPDGAHWTHSVGDDPRDCWGCIMDEVNAPEVPVGPHDPEPGHAEPEDDGSLTVYCYCGHTITAEPPRP